MPKCRNVTYLGLGTRHRVVQLRKLYEDEEPLEAIEDHLVISDDAHERNSPSPTHVQLWDYLPVNMWVLMTSFCVMGISICTHLSLKSSFQLFFVVFSGFLRINAFDTGLHSLPFLNVRCKNFLLGSM